MGTQKILEVLVMFLVDDLVVHFATKSPSLGMCCYLLFSLYLHWFYSKWHISICACAWHNKCYWLLVVPLKGYDSHHITEEHLGGKIISRSVLLCAFETTRDAGTLREPKDKLEKWVEELTWRLDFEYLPFEGIFFFISCF